MLESCEPVELEFGELLGDPAAAGYAYFPVGCFVSLIADVDAHTKLELGLIGSEGMFSPSSLLGFDAAPLHASVQGAGGALRMKGADLRRVASNSAPLRDTLNRYLCVVIAELAQSAICNRFHRIEAQLARWLLVTHDRAQSDRLELTHGRLATMLGVRRSGISVAAAALQEHKAIRYGRGEIVIVDRGRLEAAACECYRAGTAAYRQYLGNHLG